MEWISVEERLPENGALVLLTAHEWNDKAKPIFIEVGRFVGGVFVDMEGDEAYTDYWMPLPEPPETK